MTPQEFVAKWKRAELSERSSYQQHFLDLCELLEQPKPAAADPDGAWYTFEKGVRKSDGGAGWADVWLRGHFGWEYKGKGKHKTLQDAYSQLLLYRESLENPPLLVVCDVARYEVHTNFTNTVTVVHSFDLDQLPDPKNLDLLRKVFTNPEALKPGQTPESITKQAAEQFGQLADKLRLRTIPAPRAAHFLMKLMFCMFSEDIRLLPEKLFTRLLEAGKQEPALLADRLRALFEAMTKGGYFGADKILHFNGGLFNDTDVVELRPDEIEVLIWVNQYEWSEVEPSIFGTLFERSLDPEKRSQIGAHYTDREDILTLLQPVVMTPLRRRWDEVRTGCEEIREKLKAAKGARAAQAKHRKRLERTLLDFVEELAHVRILDPACGSGNFLYVAINLLLDLQKQAITYAATCGISLLPQVRPTQLAGIEINPYAQELASVVIWIGFLQWMHHNGFNPPRNPVLEPIESIRRMDAILDLSDPENPTEPEWPEADFIVGNPPFLGGKLLRSNLGDAYVDAMFRLWGERVRPEADLCCYWFERASSQIKNGKCSRAGLLATQGIRGGANRQTLTRIKSSGGIFFAESDRDWILDGANVHVSMVGFDDGTEKTLILDGRSVPAINANLSSTADITQARRLANRLGIAFQGPVKVGAFDLDEKFGIELAMAPNPHGRPNSDVLYPWVNGMDITSRPRRYWMLDFGPKSLEEAAKYEKPFEYVCAQIKPIRIKNADRQRREFWWRLGRSGDDWKSASKGLERTLFTPRVSKHRLFVWFESNTLPDSAVVAFSCSDDYFFGVLHSRPHELWALRLGTRLETRPRYTPTTCFETFAFPDPTDAQRAAIASAAKELDELRNSWLNPPEWTRTEVLEFPGSADGPWKRYIDPATVDQRGIGTVRYPRLFPKDAECAKELKKRTLTNLYNERPTWLDLAHRKLDAAVFAAYGWDPSMSDEEILAKLLELNLERAASAKQDDGQDRMKDDVLFVDALAQVANTEQVGYLGDPVIVECLLRSAIGDVMSKMTEATPPDERVQAVMSKSEEIGVILLGGSKHYSPMRNWNLPGKIDEFCAKWLGLGDSDPVTRMKHAVVNMFDELLTLAQYAGTKGVMPEQWKWQVDAIVQKYTSWFVGIDTPTQAIM